MNLNVGIDVSKLKLDYCGMDSNKQVCFQGEVTNTPKGAGHIRDEILKRSQQADQIIIGMEATSVYNFHPTLFFEQDDRLNQLNVTVVTLNPKVTHRYSKLFDDDKTDTVDAFHIADFLRIGRYQVPVTRDEKHIALQRLTRERYHLVHQINDCKNHFLNNLYYKVNTIDTVLPTSVFGSTMLSILSDEKYSLDDLVQIPLSALTDELNHLSHGRFGDAKSVARALKKAIRSSYRLSKTVADSVDQVLAMYANQLRMLNQQLKLLNKSISDLCSVISGADSLQSIPGIGPVYAAGLLAEIGQIDRFPNDASLAGYAGLSWQRSQSGNHERQLTPRTKSGNQYLRYYLVEAANSVRRYDPTYARYYQKKFREVPKYQHRRACVLTARKLVRLIINLLTEHKLYTPPKLV
ncbi:transposase [Loigolactobacillus backii]|uniref:IS110 family transposase n=1 Tax=Loigolactobacillus backii TaxID=375175 RepID=UPI0007F114B0|nr:IS110 family transposase [Loigolactobacillus backii]ANK63834.1 transposase [Loigolactobacillus backii]